MMKFVIGVITGLALSLITTSPIVYEIGKQNGITLQKVKTDGNY